MKSTEQEINEAAKKSWETKTNHPIYKKNGINPYAYILGYKSGFNDAISQMQPEWVPVSNPPQESGRYWCYCEEQNDLRKSYFQWNCSYNKHENIWSDRCKSMKVTHWIPLLEPPTK